ncbi:MAG: hypothetical protein KDA79_11710 [Planctomycetaceae bacterium]|nr:hypothetical protein [Planctomycetaceae bacterium]
MIRNNPGAMVIACLIPSLLCRSAEAQSCGIAAEPAAAAKITTETATLTPAYGWEEFPLSWRDIRAGKLPVTPVRWERFAGNPVVPSGMNARPMRWDGDTIRVWHGRRGKEPGICWFDVSPDEPQQLRGSVVGPVLSPGPADSYDGDWTISPEVIRLKDGRLRMYYSAKKKGASFFGQLWSLAVAHSEDDGQTWQKHADNPVLQVTTDKWESGAVGFCSVLRNSTGDGWRMWYLGTDEHAIKQVGLATSADGLTWKRFAGNPVVPVNPQLRWEKGAIAVPRVIQDGPLLKMWYCCYENNNTYAIGFAESIDGETWYRSPHNPVMVPEGETGPDAGKTWNSRMVAYPGVIRAGGKYLMWYSGNGYGNAGVGLATAQVPGSEGENAAGGGNASQLLYRTGATVQPDESWSSWQPVANATTEPARSGWIQFAVPSGDE